jgi:hypothetical protein
MFMYLIRIICLFSFLLLSQTSIAVSSDEKVINELNSLIPKIGKSFTPSNSYKGKDYGSTYKRYIGTWSIEVYIEDNVLKTVKALTEENGYSSSPADKFEKAVEITEEVLGSGADDRKTESRGSTKGTVETPPGLSPDQVYSGVGSYVNTTCQGNDVYTYYWSSGNIKASVYGSGGIRCIINKTGDVGQQFNGYVEIFFETN